MKIANYSQRNTARATCYTNLGTALKGTSTKDPLTNAQELKVAAIVEGSMLLGSLNTTNELAIGTIDIIAALKSVLEAQQAYALNISKLSNYLSQGGVTLSNFTTVFTILKDQTSSLETKLSQAQSDKSMLEKAIPSKQTSINNLQKEINTGSFSQNGQSFSLGTVGNQVTAQSATYSRLSANLSSKLSSLDGRIGQAQRSLNNAWSNYDDYNSKTSTNQKKADSAYSDYKKALSSWKTAYKAAGHYASYLYYKALSATTKVTAAFWKDQANAYQKQVDNLNKEKNSAKTEVNNASAEMARLQRLKTLGEQELQRKRGLLTTMNSDLSSLKNQLSTRVSSITSYQNQLVPLRTRLAIFNNAQPFVSQITSATQRIDTVKSKYGFTTLTYTNTEETERLRKEELTFEKNQDLNADMIATKTSINDLSRAVTDGLNYVKANPGKSIIIPVAAIAGTVAVCFATAGGCVIIAVAGTTAGVGSTVNGVKILTTQSDIFGNPVSDKDWGRAVAFLPVDIVSTVAGVSGLKAILGAKYGVQTAEKMIAMTVSENTEISTAAKAEIGAVVKTMVPQGVTQEKFIKISTIIRSDTKDISGDVAVHGSRGGYTARPDSDLDVAVRVSPENFNLLIEKYFKTPNPGSAFEKTKNYAISNGIIQTGEAKLSSTALSVKNELNGMSVQISIVKIGGNFDQGPYIQLTK